VKRYWNIYQSTSPSYILMASIDRCMSIVERDGLFKDYIANILNTRARLKDNLKNITLLETDDISKFILVCEDGKKLMDILLKEYGIQLEMASFRYVIAMTSVADRQEFYETFANALIGVDSRFNACEGDKLTCNYDYDVAMSPAEALSAQDIYGFEDFAINSCEIYGKISLSAVLLYPPGMPVVNVGERITREVVEILVKAQKAGLEVPGLIGEGKIRCLR